MVTYRTLYLFPVSRAAGIAFVKFTMKFFRSVTKLTLKLCCSLGTYRTTSLEVEVY